MLKKVVFFALAMTFVFVGMASAAQNVANTTQKGSLLIFPKILVQGYQEGEFYIPVTDTFVSIANDYYTDVWVKCYWVDEYQNVEDFMFRLTPNQPVIFSATWGLDLDYIITVPPFGARRGELKCWAVDAQGYNQIAFNHLYGYATIAQENAAVTYNAWSFTARSVAQGSPVGTPGNILLTGAAGGYDACPQYLVTNFVAANLPVDLDPWEEGAKPDLTLVPCKQDLRQDRLPTCTKAKFDIWNANETKYTGAYRCFKCWFEGFLDEIAPPYGFGGEKFTYNALHTVAARFRVQSANNSACRSAFPACSGSTWGPLTPFVGVMLYATQENGYILPWTGYEPHTAGTDGSGFVLWDPQGPEVPEAPVR